MTGKGISTSVNRAFTVIGLLFVFGSFYLGTLTYIGAPEIYEIEGKILSVTVEKRRPLGFENIPVDSTELEHKDIPLNTDFYAVVEYKWNEEISTSEIVSWENEPGWTEGTIIPLYLVEGEEEYPLNYYPSEAAGEQKEALIIFLAMPFMGGILALVGIFSKRRERTRDLALLKKVRKLSGTMRPVMTYNRTLYEGVNRGNYFLGGIMMGIGALLTILMIAQLIKNFSSASFDDWMILPFPLLLGIGILYIGLSEFIREEILVTDRRVFLKRWSLFGTKKEERKISSFGGIREQILEKEVPGSMKRHIYREQVLLHEDPLFNGISIALIPDNKKAEAAARDLSVSLNLPRILMDGKKVILDYPDTESVRESSPDDTVDSEPMGDFPAKYLTLEIDEPDSLLVTRSFMKSLIWGAILFAGGLTAAVLTGAFTLLIPTIVMSMIFDAIAFRRDELEVKESVLRVERFFLGKTYYSETLALKDVEEVLSGNDPRVNNAGSIEIIGEGKRIYFGQAASEGELNWLKVRLRLFMKTEKNI